MGLLGPGMMGAIGGSARTPLAARGAGRAVGLLLHAVMGSTFRNWFNYLDDDQPRQQLEVDYSVGTHNEYSRLSLSLRVITQFRLNYGFSHPYERLFLQSNHTLI